MAKRLHLGKDKKVFGVCSGIAEYYGWDPTIVRLAWVVLTLLTAVAAGIILYIVAYIIMPKS